MTSAREHKHHVRVCATKGIKDCCCDRYFSQPDCDIGWDSSRFCFYHGYDLYMLVASDSESDLLFFPLLSLALRHDSHKFLHTFFRIKSFLPEFNISKLLLDSAHNAMPIYKRCKHKDDFTIGKDGFPVCKEGCHMKHESSEPSKNRMKYCFPLASRKYGCSYEPPSPIPSTEELFTLP